MHWRIISVFVALFVLANAQQSWRSHRRWTPSDNLIDIDVETERNSASDQGWQEYEEMSGSGSGMEDTDDEDLLASGSGSGAGVPDFTDTAWYTVKAVTSTTTTTRTTTTRQPLSPCEQLREASQHLSGNYVPQCNRDGDYDSVQCHGFKLVGNCWCADLSGREIPGTALTKGSVPDCDHGTNLAPCVFTLVQQSRKERLNDYRPQCTLQGDFERTQCNGGMCHCVDSKTGVKVLGTEVFMPDRPNCDEHRTPAPVDKTEKTITLFPPPHVTRPTPREPEVQTKININIGGRPGGKGEGEKPDDSEPDSEPDTPNQTGTGGEPVKEPSSASTVDSMMTQPGILAAIIGGSVVLLLCAILLAMFIVYRMRKKDEGSYALDEPKKMPNYSYQRAPDKEFYA